MRFRTESSATFVIILHCLRNRSVTGVVMLTRLLHSDQDASRARPNGFTLIEIMVVIVIIGILAALIAPQIFGQIEKARVTKAKHDIRAIETALEMYKIDNFRYPTTEQGLRALVEKPLDAKNWKEGGYVREL